MDTNCIPLFVWSGTIYSYWGEYIARKALREEDQAAKKDGGTVDWNYLLTRMD